jgi:hypothetical protein
LLPFAIAHKTLIKRDIQKKEIIGNIEEFGFDISVGELPSCRGSQVKEDLTGQEQAVKVGFCLYQQKDIDNEKNWQQQGA